MSDENMGTQDLVETTPELPPTPPPAAEPPAQPVTSSQASSSESEWKKRAAGFQNAMQQWQKRANDLEARNSALEAELATVRAQLTEVNSRVSDLSTNAKSTVNQVEDLQAQLATEQTAHLRTTEKLERLRLLVNEAPHLVGVYDSIAPGANLEEFRSNVERMSGALTKTQRDAFTERMAGSTPPPPPPAGSPQNSQDPYAAAMASAGTGDELEEMRRLYENSQGGS